MTLRQRLDAAIGNALGTRVVGCVILVSEDGNLTYARAAGLADREAGTPMREDAIFRLASVTKPIVATTALRMIDLGLLSLQDPAAKYLPYFRPKAPDGSTPDILIRHLLTHTSGLTYNLTRRIAGGLSGPIIPLEENLQRLAKRPLAFTPGTAWAYGMSIDVLGGVLAAINASKLSEVVARYVTGPLGMPDTVFAVGDKSRLATPYADDSPPRRMGKSEHVNSAAGDVTVFSPGRIHDAAAPQSGGAGMAGTARDLMVLLEALRAADILKPATGDAAFANQIGQVAMRPQDAGKRFGFLGAIIANPVAGRKRGPAGTVDWGGAYGHNWIIDRKNKLSVVTYTNTAFEGCNGAFRDDILGAVYG
jgi:CubicO group peptidase (beta-lactamase class C family)